MLGIVSLVTCAAPAIGPVFGGVLKSHFPPKFIIIGFAGTVIMDAVFVTLSGNVWVVAIAANDGADAAVKGQHYRYPHSFPDRWVEQQYLPDVLKGTQYYYFGDNKTEQAARAYWERVKKRKL